MLVLPNIFHIQSGRQSRPKRPREQRLCQKCPEHYIEDEAHFLFEGCEDKDIKFDLTQRISMDFPQFSDMPDKYLQYQIIMKIEDPELLKYLGFCVNMLLRNREEIISR